MTKKITKAKSKGWTKFVVQCYIEHNMAQGGVSSHQINQQLIDMLPESAKCLCKSVEFELQTDVQNSPRAVVCIDRVVRPADHIGISGVCLTQREPRVLSWAKMVVPLGMNPYFYHPTTTIPFIQVNVLSTQACTVRLKFRGYYKPTKYVFGAGMRGDYLTGQEN